MSLRGIREKDGGIPVGLPPSHGSSQRVGEEGAWGGTQPPNAAPIDTKQITTLTHYTAVTNDCLSLSLLHSFASLYPLSFFCVFITSESIIIYTFELRYDTSEMNSGSLDINVVI